ncbi:MAG: amino acid adenylation domain-containing protein, partial [Planctomycetota bacterium]
MLGKTECESIIAKGKGPVRGSTTEFKALDELFVVQTRRRPNEVAVHDSAGSTTYEQLNNRAEEIAKQFRQFGVGTEVRVGVAMSRSVDLVATILGVLKAGGAYVPLDPQYPAERTQFILQDAKCRVLCNDSGIRVADPCDEPSNPSPALRSRLSQRESEANRAKDRLAYVIYTSGSTGIPKGVAIEHRSAVAMVQWALNEYSPTELSGVLASTSICFDLSVFELFVPLAAGESIVMAENLLALPRHRAKNEVTLVNTVPSLLRQLLTLHELPKTVTTVNLAGEPLPADLVQDLHSRSVARVFNLYGPSEDTTYSTVAPLHRGVFDPETQRVHIGKPVDNTQAFVLDSAKRMTPLGLTGELYLGGDGLARGYLDRHELTSEAFISNPISSHPHRLYRTGDRVRMRDDGVLDFLGRIDDQFKIRGYRIEAGEIEAALRNHPRIDDALVVANEDQGQRSLLAYIVTSKREDILTATGEGALDIDALTSDLQGFLSERLPTAMVPTLWQPVETIPRLPNGKVDRQKLPKPSLSDRRSFSPAATNTERELIEIWEALLNESPIGRDDNFFHLGGHSLLAIEMVTRVESRLGVHVPLRKLFECPTIGQLGRFVDHDAVSKADSASNRLSEITADLETQHEPFGLTDIQQAYWLGRSQAFELGNISTHGYREIETQGLEHLAIQDGLNQLIRRHAMLRAVVGSDGKQRVLPNVPDYEIQITDIEQGENPETVCVHRRDELSHQVFDTTQWPLFHVEAIRLGNQRTRYFVSFDVMLGDAWSLQILGRELKQLLFGVRLEPISLTFRDYVIHQQAFSKSVAYEASWDFWKNKLQCLPSAPELPLIKRPSEIETPQFKRRSHRLSPEQSSRFKEFAKRHQVTPSTAVLVAFAELVGTYSRHRHFTLNLTLFNRPSIHHEIDHVIGDFTSSTLMDFDQRNGDSFGTRASSTQADLWEALEHRAVSGVRLIREIARQKNQGAGALMPVVFTSTLGFDGMQDESTSARDGLEERAGRAIGGVEQMMPSPALRGRLSQGESEDQSVGGDWSADVVYSVSQTSQVYLDHQVSEIDGQLVLNWDCIDELFPLGVLDEMFHAYVGLMQELSDEQSVWESNVDDLVISKTSAIATIEEINTPAIGSSRQTSGLLLHELFFRQAAESPAFAA